MSRRLLSRREFLRGCCCCAVAGAISPVAADGEAPGLSVTPLAEGVWLHTTWKMIENGRLFPSNGLLVAGTERALLIDTTWPVADMAPLLAEARRLTGGRPLDLVVTHAHDDRMSGIEVARAQGIPSYAYALTREDASRRGLPPADSTWEDEKKRFDLGGSAVELFYPGPAHTRDNTVAFIEGAGVLFGGCMLRVSTLGNIADADLDRWASSMERVIQEYGARTTIAVPGHGEPGGRELLEYTRAIAARAREERG